MFKRQFTPSKFSYFIFGPRGTGKTTWMKENYPDALYVNLLRAQEYRELLKNPSILGSWIESAKPGTVIVDEIQKLPELLDEVQSLMMEYHKIQFVLTGSSARKLKRLNSNLLAGRARTKEFYTITSSEMNFDFHLNDILKYGCLPEVLNLKTSADKVEFLDSYVQTYINEEIKQEAIVRQLEPFMRFLEVSSIMNGQIWNNSEISREVGCGRSSVDGYISVLLDTLLARRIDAYRARAKVKEKYNPKYYYFDSGVVRALGGQLQKDIESVQVGYLFETFILNELNAYSSYRQRKLKICYWGTPSKNEVDFVVETEKQKIGIELKTSASWKSDFNFGLQTLIEEKKIDLACGVYNGERSLVSQGIHVFTVKSFLKKLWADELI